MFVARVAGNAERRMTAGQVVDSLGPWLSAGRCPDGHGTYLKWHLKDLPWRKNFLSLTCW
jgi:hypothetical protein